MVNSASVLANNEFDNASVDSLEWHDEMRAVHEETFFLHGEHSERCFCAPAIEAAPGDLMRSCVRNLNSPPRFAHMKQGEAVKFVEFLPMDEICPICKQHRTPLDLTTQFPEIWAGKPTAMTCRCERWVKRGSEDRVTNMKNAPIILFNSIAVHVDGWGSGATTMSLRHIG